MTKPKFPMHNMHYYKSLKTVYTACALTATTAFLYYYLQHLPLRAAYTDFYSNYDGVASFNRMMADGYISAFPAPSKEDDKAKDKDKDKKK